MKLLLTLLLAIASPAGAEVVAATPAGFEVSHSLMIDAPPAALWRMLITPAHWWNKDHSWSGDAANLSLDPRPGGCFCEGLPGAASSICVSSTPRRTRNCGWPVRSGRCRARG